MPNRKLSPEGEVIAAYGAAMVAAFQVLNVARFAHDNRRLEQSPN